MKALAVVTCAALFAAGAYWLGRSLSSDALGLLLGVTVGVCSALPGALLNAQGSARLTEEAQALDEARRKVAQERALLEAARWHVVEPAQPYARRLTVFEEEEA